MVESQNYQQASERNQGKDAQCLILLIGDSRTSQPVYGGKPSEQLLPQGVWGGELREEGILKLLDCQGVLRSLSCAGV